MVAVCAYPGIVEQGVALHTPQSWWPACGETGMTAATTSTVDTHIARADTLVMSRAAEDLLALRHTPPSLSSFVFKPYTFRADFASNVVIHPQEMPSSQEGDSRPLPPASSELSTGAAEFGQDVTRQESPEYQRSQWPARPPNFVPPFLPESDLPGMRRPPRRRSIDLTGPHPPRTPPTQTQGGSSDRRKRRYAFEGGPVRARSRSSGSTRSHSSTSAAEPTPHASATYTYFDSYACGNSIAAASATSASHSAQFTTMPEPASSTSYWRSPAPISYETAVPASEHLPNALCAFPSFPPPPAPHPHAHEQASTDFQESATDDHPECPPGTAPTEFDTWAAEQQS